MLNAAPFVLFLKMCIKDKRLCAWKSMVVCVVDALKGHNHRPSWVRCCIIHVDFA